MEEPLRAGVLLIKVIRKLKIKNCLDVEVSDLQTHVKLVYFFN